MNLVNKLLNHYYLVYFFSDDNMKEYVYSDTRETAKDGSIGILTITHYPKLAKRFKTKEEAIDQLKKLKNKNNPSIEVCRLGF